MSSTQSSWTDSGQFYIISTKFLSLSRRGSSWQNILSREEQGETAVTRDRLKKIGQ